MYSDDSKTIGEIFLDIIEEIENNCKLARVPIGEICKMHGISRTNISRWKKNIPETIAAMQVLQVESRARLAKRTAERMASRDSVHLTENAAPVRLSANGYARGGKG